MENYRKTSHTKYDCKYHIVWITKYKKKVLGGIVGERVRELIRGIGKEQDVEIIQNHVSQDHVHVFVSVPPHMTISKLVQYMKGRVRTKCFKRTKCYRDSFGDDNCGDGVILWRHLAMLLMK